MFIEEDLLVSSSYFFELCLIECTFPWLSCFLLLLILLLFVKPPRFLFLFLFLFVEIFSVYVVCFQEGVGHIVGWNVQIPVLLNLWFLISPEGQDLS